MAGPITGKGSIPSSLSISPSANPEISKKAEKKFSSFTVSKVDVERKMPGADQGAAKAVPEKKIDTRKIARQSVVETKIRLSKNQSQVVQNLLSSEKDTSEMGRFEKRFKREVIGERRKRGLSRTDSISKSSLKKAIKKAVKLNINLIKQKGNSILKAQDGGGNSPVKKAPHTDVLGLSDFSQMAGEDQENIKSHVMLGAAAYKGFHPELSGLKIPSDCTLLSKEELPVELQLLYDDQTGLIHSPDNAKAMVVRKGDEIVLAFAGTEPGSADKTGRSGTIKTDVTQWLGISTPSMYRSAAAVFDLLLSHKPLANAKFSVAGHSLGGGLAQFAYTAMQGRHDPERLAGAITINPAGLSQGTLNKLGDERVSMAKNSIQNIRIEGDPVSPSGKGKAGVALKGSLIGSIMTLPDPEKRGMGVHSSDVAIDVVESYME